MTRALFATAGLLVLAFVWGILPFLGAPPFSAHMMMHMALVVIAAPLFAVAIAGSRIDPVTRAPRLCSAIVASMLELVLVWAWHAPLLHHAARHHGWARALEQASFLAAGLLFVDRRSGRWSAGAPRAGDSGHHRSLINLYAYDLARCSSGSRPSGSLRSSRRGVGSVRRPRSATRRRHHVGGWRLGLFWRGAVACRRSSPLYF